MKILGVDPGLIKTGWGIIQVGNANSISYIASGTIYTDVKRPLNERLQMLHDGLSQVINLHQPNESAIEETFLNKNPMSSLKLGHARGSLILTMGLSGLNLSEYSATKIKKTVTGVGRADKNQVGVMVKFILPKAQPKTEDEADALAVAICHSYYRNSYAKKI